MIKERIKVLHYDYGSDSFFKEVDDFSNKIENYPIIKCDFYDGLFKPSSDFICDKESLEKILGNYDVLIIHPGVDGQPIILKEFPSNYPNLKIGIVSPHIIIRDYDPIDETKYPNIRLFPYEEQDMIIEFILAPKK